MINFNIDRIDYINHSYNNTLSNERAIEIVLAKRYLKIFTDIIEIGAVMPYYEKTSHTIYDPFDDHPKNIKKFAEEIEINNKNILSISTIEHFGEGDTNDIYKDVEINKSFAFINKLNYYANSYLITLPIGYNQDMDICIKNNISQFLWIGYFKKDNSPTWEISTDIDKIMSFQYGYPFSAANAIICIYKF